MLNVYLFGSTSSSSGVSSISSNPISSSENGDKPFPFTELEEMPEIVHILGKNGENEVFFKIKTD